MTTNELAITAEHLRKIYGTVVAVDDISLEVRRGEIFGMVGPNGAGKTTAVECIEGLRTPTNGHISVLGLDPQSDRFALRARIGIQLQESALQARIKVWEAIDLFASLYPRATDWRSLLGDLGLADKSKAHFAELSGGQKQRLFVALALVNDPELVFLDELTTGLDPQGRHAMWDMVRSMRDRGKTIFLITHYMEEAERLCDRVAVVDQGRIVAMDSPDSLIRGLGVAARVVFTVDGTVPLEQLRAMRGVSDVTVSSDRVTVSGSDESLLADLINTLAQASVRYHEVHTEQPTLEDVFLRLTGRAMRE